MNKGRNYQRPFSSLQRVKKIEPKNEEIYLEDGDTMKDLLKTQPSNIEPKNQNDKRPTTITTKSKKVESKPLIIQESTQEKNRFKLMKPPKVNDIYFNDYIDTEYKIQSKTFKNSFNNKTLFGKKNNELFYYGDNNISTIPDEGTRQSILDEKVINLTNNLIFNL